MNNFTVEKVGRISIIPRNLRSAFERLDQRGIPVARVGRYRTYRLDLRAYIHVPEVACAYLTPTCLGSLHQYESLPLKRRAAIPLPDATFGLIQALSAPHLGAEFQI
jgi:hypothetical protein